MASVGVGAGAGHDGGPVHRVNVGQVIPEGRIAFDVLAVKHDAGVLVASNGALDDAAIADEMRQKRHTDSDSGKGGNEVL